MLANSMYGIINFFLLFIFFLNTRWYSFQYKEKIKKCKTLHIALPVPPPGNDVILGPDVCGRLTLYMILIILNILICFLLSFWQGLCISYFKQRRHNIQRYMSQWPMQASLQPSFVTVVKNLFHPRTWVVIQK